jgi:hypothetical protein
MKWISLLAITLLFVNANAQSNYTEAIKQGDDAFKNQQYKTAINKYFAAEAFDPLKKAEVKNKVNKVFDRIETLRAETEHAKIKTQEALSRAEKLIDAFYFYQGSFALAFKNNKFYFINKSGDKVDKLEEWESAEQFSESGFAKVKKTELGKLQDYIIDTFGHKYLVAYNINDFDSSKEALSLLLKEGDSLTISTLAQNSLRVLILNKDYWNHKFNISNLMEKICQIKNLENLQLNHFDIVSLPIQIGDLKNLAYLNLAYNELTCLPIQIGRLRNLTYLNLSLNRLDTLPSQIRELKNLKSLYLESNRLSSLPYWIGELKNLTSLYLESNSLTSLPSQIGELKKLRFLNLGWNKLVSLPSQLWGLRKLTNVGLENNHLNPLPVEISRLENLEYLNLTGNPFMKTERKEIRSLLPNCHVLF